MENQDDYLSTLEELEAARNQLANYQSLLRDLPELYERKFEERLRPIRDHIRALSQEGAGLREQFNQALPAAHQPQRQGLPAATDAPMAAQTISTANTPVIPSARSRTLLPLGLASAASLLLLATLGPLASWMHHFNSSSSAPPSPLPPIRQKQPAPVSIAAPGELVLTASAPTWLEVHDADDHPLMAETFQGKRRIPLGRGLRLLAGRPDLITIQLPGTPPRRLGSIDAVDWQTIKPTEPIPVRASHRTAAPAAPVAQGTRPSPPPGRPVTPTLLVQASEPSWIQVRGINGDAVYDGLLSGKRRFPLGRGLEVLSGRADTVSIAIDQAAPKRLGSIDDLGWHRFMPPASRPSVATTINPLPATPTQPTSSKPMSAKPQARVSLWDSLGISPFFAQKPSKRQAAKVAARPMASSPSPGHEHEAAAEALILRASEPTWLEVRDANDRPVLAENFQGQRRIPLGKGLRLLAGRPDLLTVQRQGKPPQRLGNIDDLQWFRFAPAPKPRSAT
jgi:hypothetical protein